MPSDREHHPVLPPSSFPMLAECPCYQSGEPGEAAESGTRQHKLLAAMLDDAVVIPEDHFGCTAVEQEQVAWATDYVRLRTSGNREIEKRLSLVGDDFEDVTFGTLDVADLVNRAGGDKLVVMDYKSGEDHGYLSQMAVYARMAMQVYGVAVCEVHEVYGRYRRANHYDLSMADTDFVLDIAARVMAPDKTPTVCRFCGWCRHQGKCAAATEPIAKVAAEYEPEHPVAKLGLGDVVTWHASQITDPRQMSLVLQVAEHVGKWAEAVKAHAREAAMKGMAIPGYVLKPGRRDREFTDISAAYQASGLAPDEFLSCCEASVAKVEKAVAGKAGHTSAAGKAAKEAFDRLMGGLVVFRECAPTLGREAMHA